MRRRSRRWLAGAVLLAPAALLLGAPQGLLTCSVPYVEETSPDGRWTITVCRRPMLFAMPGGGSDAPGWVVLRDEESTIRGVSSLAMIQLYGSASPGSGTEWSGGRVSRALVFELPLAPASGAVRRWLDDRIWRVRAMFGLTPSDTDVT